MNHEGAKATKNSPTTPQYADAQSKIATPPPLARPWTVLTLIMLLAISATLAVRAMRWDRWAHYHDTHRPRWDALLIESHSSFEAWRAWRACWDRGLAAAIVSGSAILMAVVVVLPTWRRGRFGKWLLLLLLLHAGVIAYFVLRWGPLFRHPPANWTG
jgi:hypothetical protein